MCVALMAGVYTLGLDESIDIIVGRVFVYSDDVTVCLCVGGSVPGLKIDTQYHVTCDHVCVALMVIFSRLKYRLLWVVCLCIVMM